MNFNIKHLRAFREVYYAGRLAEAADKLSLTTSAISVLLGQFEASGGVRLFDRTPRGLKPTEAAHEAIKAVERVLHEIDVLEHGFATGFGQSVDALRFAATQTVASMLMPAVIREFCELHPNTQVSMYDCASDQLVDVVMRDEVEFAIGSFTEDTATLSVDVLSHDRLSAIFHVDSPLASLPQVRWSDLRDLPIIVPRHAGNGGIRKVLEETLSRSGLALHFTHEATSMNTALQMASHGFGVAVYPALLVPYFGLPELATRELTNPTIDRRLCAARRKGHVLSAQAVEFMEMVRAKVAA